MQPFLDITAQTLLDKYGDSLSDCCIVLPNRRAGLFFKRYLAKKINKGIWAPEIFSSEDFIARVSGVEIIDNVSLLFELYGVYKNIKKEEADSFDEFSKWGQILLHDFNEVDRYLIDAENLYKNLSQVKEIENWSLNTETHTDFQKNYLKFWDLLGVLYRDFRKKLIDSGKVYQGLAYKIAADEVAGKTKNLPWKKIIFTGFNALNTAEEKIIETLLNLDKAEIIWDSDTYYLKNYSQEAGKFLRKYKSMFNKHPFTAPGSNLLTDEKNITVIGVPKNSLQAKIAGDIITEQLRTNVTIENTAIVLADESLLFPVLHSLPENIKDVNVTMGYPVKSSPVASLFQLLINLHDNSAKFQKGKSIFYHKDVINLLSHPFLNKKGDINRKIIRQLLQKNIVFVSVQLIEDSIDKKAEFEKLKPLFLPWNNITDALISFSYLIDFLKTDSLSELDSEFIFSISKIVKRITSLANQYGYISDIKSLRNIFNEFISSATLPFYGEPLQGLQLMGMLETRTLDFETVIVLSANEDILPAGKSNNSFIPFDLKRVFELPTYSDKDAIFAYHFYRLIQRAKNIYLLYNTEPDLLGSGEKSRFITQLLYELPKVNKNIKISEKIVDQKISAIVNSELTINKTPDILNKLKEKAEQGFSPSLLNIYKNCSLQFYFHLIAGLRDADEIQETIAVDTLGTVIHSVLEQLYYLYKGKILNADFITEMKSDVKVLIQKSFEKYYKTEDLFAGKNYLTFKIAVKFINDFLEKEILFIKKSEKEGKPLTLNNLEEKLTCEIVINKNFPVRLKGSADRIDNAGAATRIIDYKTGAVDDRELKVNDWDMLISDPEYSKSFQLLMYGLMYKRTYPEVTNLKSGIISFRQLSASIKPVLINGSDNLTHENLNLFEEKLKSLLEEIYNEKIPFTQTLVTENCEYCSFKSICNR